MAMESIDHKESVSKLIEDAETRFGSKFDGLNENEELQRVYGEVMEFRNSDAEEVLESDPEYNGFEADKDISDLKEQLKRVFGSELLQACVISRFVNRPDITNVLIGNKDMYMPTEVYEQWADENPAVRNFKVRAENYSNWVEAGFTNGLMPLPIHVYSFSGERLDQYDYLDDLAESQRMLVYKFGAVAHEVAHHMVTYLITDEAKKEIFDLCLAAPSLTPYIEKYRSGVHRDEEQVAEEQFCEAVRLVTTTPEYLKAKSPELYECLTALLPDMQTVELDKPK